MRSMHIFSFAALVVVACGGNKFQTFDDAGNPDGGVDGTEPPPGDGGCPFCGVDASGDGSTTGGCNPNPANFDVPGNNCDDDGDGIVDNPQGMCDTGLPTASPTAAQLAKAIGICPNKGDTWGVTSAAYSQGYNSNAAPLAQQYGTSATFGTNVKARQGNVLGILSSGVAAAQDCNGGVFKGNVCTTTGQGAAPPGYPKPSVINQTSCPVSSVANDVVNVVLKVQVPANAKGFSFDFSFYSGEWPEYECTTFNDSFVTWLTSSAFKGKTVQNQPTDFNISFDPTGNPINVNNSFFEVCSPAGLKCSNMPVASTCKLTNSELQGTGFYSPGTYCGLQADSGGGATGWLTTQAPVTPGETITIQFMVWNTGDEAFDSSVLLDNWQWVATDTTVSTSRPPN